MSSAPATKHPLLWVPSGYFTMALTYNMLTAAAVLVIVALVLSRG